MYICSYDLIKFLRLMDLSRNKIYKITPFGVKFPEIDLKERLVCLDEK